MTRKRAIQTGISAVVVIVIFVVVLPQVADLSEVWSTLAAMTWLEVGTLGLIAAWNLVTYWILLMTTLPGLKLGQAMVVTETSTAVANVLPGGQAFGMALSYSMYASWGFRRAAIATSLVVSGVGDLFAKLAMPVFAIALLAFYGGSDAALKTGAFIALTVLVVSFVVFRVSLSSEQHAHQVGEALARAFSFILRAVRRPPVTGWGNSLANFRTETLRLLHGRWWTVIASSLLSHLSLFLVLLMALRHVGVSEEEVAGPEALGAFAFVRLLSALPVTPGGLGVIELGLTAALAVAGGPRDQVLAAVLAFRALTYLIQIPFGALTYLYWQHSSRWRSPSVEQPAPGARTPAARGETGV